MIKATKVDKNLGFTCSFIHSFIHLFIHSGRWSLTHPSFTNSPFPNISTTQSFNHSLKHSLTHSLSSSHILIHNPFTHSLTLTRMHTHPITHTHTSTRRSSQTLTNNKSVHGALPVESTIDRKCVDNFCSLHDTPSPRYIRTVNQHNGWQLWHRLPSLMWQWTCPNCQRQELQSICRTKRAKQNPATMDLAGFVEVI